jgi:hypothetical protein
VLEPAEKILDFSGTDVRGRELERRLLGQSAMRSREPGSGIVEVAFERLKSQADQAGQSKEPIRLLRLEPLRVFPPGKRTGPDLEDFTDAGRRQVENGAETVEGIVRQTLADPRVQIRRLEGAQAE